VIVAGDGPARTLTCERDDARPQRQAQPGGGVIESKAACPHDPGMSAIAPAAIRRMGRGAAHGSEPQATARLRAPSLRRAGTFAAIGVLSTLAYVALYGLLRPLVAAAVANVVALVATAVGNTAANRRYTFAVRGRDGMARDHAAGLLALGVALAITTTALAGLDVVAPGAPQAVEVVILVAANGAATLVRFVILRAALERRRPRAARAARPGPVRPHPSVERTAR
jgi:putative flippase GtrA